ncbi:type IV toxin-antitoxin system AbiEi family antitoxin domain-containing protein [Gaoshiqia sediminis]|uniref:Type IV toxin-antitoxin system AbiEi family antitoxin n=1 Tax=Gaoshiqia sediminis TaxID=2986998 RepID=A0AA41Y3T3_9BACT|nr:type IV toxin-antitoxin system AbiEi family antitoxin [Gaoshiqia sediminis]MCW0481359.1 type IV toxin-antitoxin system AbiEi family antitoxin [Gaoshiqia sediminis]
METRFVTLEGLVNDIRAKGRYSFGLDEVKHELGLSGNALNQALFRLKNKNKIAQIRRGFFAIITPEYSRQGMIPPNLFIDDLMLSLEKKYYVGLFSAAALFGAGHQQPMEYYVITEKPALRDIKGQKLIVNFYVKQDWSENDIIQKKTDAGYINVSSPELTALDLLTYGNFGINRVLTILEELTEEMKPSDLTRVARNYFVTSSIQRLGYLIDKEIGDEKLAVAVKRALKEKKIQTVQLLKNVRNKGITDPDWKININTELESDL